MGLRVWEPARVFGMRDAEAWALVQRQLRATVKLASELDLDPETRLLADCLEMVSLAFDVGMHRA